MSLWGRKGIEVVRRKRSSSRGSRDGDDAKESLIRHKEGFVPHVNHAYEVTRRDFQCGKCDACERNAVLTADPTDLARKQPLLERCLALKDDPATTRKHVKEAALKIKESHELFMREQKRVQVTVTEDKMESPPVYAQLIRKFKSKKNRIVTSLDDQNYKIGFLKFKKMQDTIEVYTDQTEKVDKEGYQFIELKKGTEAAHLVRGSIYANEKVIAVNATTFFLKIDEFMDLSKNPLDKIKFKEVKKIYEKHIQSLVEEEDQLATGSE